MNGTFLNFREKKAEYNYSSDSRQYFLWEWRRRTNPRQGGGKEGMSPFNESSEGEEMEPDPLFFEVPAYLQEWCNGNPAAKAPRKMPELGGRPR